MLIISFLISPPSLKFTIILYLSDHKNEDFDIADPSSTQNACHTCNLYMAPLITSLRSSVVRASDRCSEGHRFNSCRTQIFSLSHAREMLITSFLNINVFNPLGPKSVQHQFSPNNISRSTRVKVMRITKLMTKGRIL